MIASTCTRDAHAADFRLQIYNSFTAYAYVTSIILIGVLHAGIRSLSVSMSNYKGSSSCSSVDDSLKPKKSSS